MIFRIFLQLSNILLNKNDKSMYYIVYIRKYGKYIVQIALLDSRASKVFIYQNLVERL